MIYSLQISTCSVKKKKKQTPVRYTDYKILSHDSSVDTDVQGSLTIASSSTCSMGD